MWTVEDVIRNIGNYPLYVTAFLCLPAVLALINGFFYKSGYKPGFIVTPADYFYSVLVYMVCIPGIIACVLIAYTLFFTRGNLLQVNMLVYFMPIIAMIVTLSLIKRKTAFKRLPGFDHLAGLMIVIGITFVILLLIYKTRIFIVFFSSIFSLFMFGVVLFILLKIGMKKLF